MKFENPEIDALQLLAVLHERYPDVLCGDVSAQFCPVGEDAWCYTVSSDTSPGCFVRVETEAGSGSTLQRLEAAGAITEQLHASCGMRDVVAPMRDCNGSLASVLPPRFVLQVFPHVSGQQAMTMDGTVRDDDRLAAIRFVARLHWHGHQLLQSSSVVADSLANEQFEHGHATAVQRAMAYAMSATSEPRTRWQAATCDALLADQAGVEWLLRALQQMEEELRSQPEWYDVVLTHSECHLANFVRSDIDDQLHCVDWGDLALGPRERDLALLCCDGSAAALLSAYIGETPSLSSQHENPSSSKSLHMTASFVCCQMS